MSSLLILPVLNDFISVDLSYEWQLIFGYESNDGDDDDDEVMFPCYELITKFLASDYICIAHPFHLLRQRQHHHHHHHADLDDDDVNEYHQWQSWSV